MKSTFRCTNSAIQIHVVLLLACIKYKQMHFPSAERGSASSRKSGSYPQVLPTQSSVTRTSLPTRLDSSGGYDANNQKVGAVPEPRSSVPTPADRVEAPYEEMVSSRLDSDQERAAAGQMTPRDRPAGAAVSAVCVVSCRGVSWRVVSCRVVACRGVSCRGVSCLVVSCRVVSCRGVSWRVVSCRVVACRVVSCRVVSGRVGTGRVGSGRVGSGRVGSGRVGSGRVGSGRRA